MKYTARVRVEMEDGTVVEYDDKMWGVRIPDINQRFIVRAEKKHPEYKRIEVEIK